MSDSQPNSHSSPTEALQTLEAAEDRTAWGQEDWAWDAQTCKATLSKSTSPKDHHPCSAPANLAKAIPQISGELKSKPNTSEDPSTTLPSSGDGVATAAEDAPAAQQAAAAAASSSYGRPGYCQADGCGKNLSKLTFYHVRNKICEVHIKADQFAREGAFLRFCQRCGYPHPLDEFDGTKHSCRAQLEKHNARRRKKQADAAAEKGGKRPTAGKGAAVASAAAVAGTEKREEDEDQDFAPSSVKVKEQQKRQQQQPCRTSRRQKTRFTAAEVEMDEGDEEGEEEAKQVAKEKSRPSTTTTAAAAIEPERAASPSLPFLNFNTADLVIPQPGDQQQQQQQKTGASTGPTTDSTSAAAEELEKEDQPLMIDELESWLNSQLSDLQHLGSLRPVGTDAGATGGNALAPLLPLPDRMSSFDFANGLMQFPDDSEMPSLSDTTRVPPLYDSMTGTTASGNPFPLPSAPLPAPAAATGPTLTKEAVLSTVSVKLFGCTPAELPADLREQLSTWFIGQVASLEGYLRPGCVHLTVQATVETKDTVAIGNQAEDGKARTRSKRRQPEGKKSTDTLHVSLVTTGGVSCLVEKMLSSGEPLWRSKTLLVQAGNEVALVHGGMLKQIWEIGSTQGERAVPAVLEVKPVVLLTTHSGNVAKKKCCGGGGGAAEKQQQQEIVIKGVNLLQNDCEIVCRLQGEYVAVESAGCADCCCSASVKACCQSGSAASGSKGNSSAAASGEWESKCCGCCVSKLASLSLHNNETEEEENKAAKKKKTSSCCASKEPAAAAATTEALVDTVTPQSVSLKLDTTANGSGMLLRPGVLHIDVLKNAFMAPQGGRVLVVDSPAVHAELLQLAARAPTAATAWTDALGVVFEWVGDRKKIEFSIVERTAAKLLQAAIFAGLVEVAKYLHALLHTELMATASSVALPQGVAGLDALAFLSQADQACKTITLLRVMKFAENSSGMKLLHLAVQSQNPACVELVLSWSRECDMPWRCDVKGLYGLTPLHLATLVRDPAIAAQMVLTLVASCEPGVQAWREAKTIDGITPAEFAQKLGRVGLVATFGGPAAVQEENQQQQQPQEKHLLLPAALAPLVTATKNKTADGISGILNQKECVMDAPSTPRRCKCTGDCPCALSAEPCASCSGGSSDEEGCCGSENGQCCCCSGGKTQEEVDIQREGGCCAARTLARACCH